MLAAEDLTSGTDNVALGNSALKNATTGFNNKSIDE